MSVFFIINIQYKENLIKIDKNLTKMENRIERYVKKHHFPSYEICKEKIEKYQSNIHYSKYEYIVCKRIYENLWNDKKVITYGKTLYEINGLKGLTNCCLLMNILLDNVKLRILQSYGRKLEFLFKEVTPEWDA